MRKIKDICKGRELIDVLTQGYYDFKFFAEEIVHSVDGSQLKLANFHLEWINLIRNHPRVCIVAPRGHSKTTLLGVVYPIWLCLYHKNKTVLVISHREDQAIRIIKSISYTIRHNELLRDLKPKEGYWSKSEITTSTDCRILSHPYTDKVRGLHVDYLIVDEGSLFPELETFYNAILPTIYAKSGKCVVIGTPLTKVDLLADLKRNPKFITKYYPAIKEDGTPLWPERFSFQKLKDIERSIGESRFMREYLLTVDVQVDQAFPPELIFQCVNPNLSYMDTGLPEEEYYMGVDLAISPKGDYSVIAVLRKKEGKYTLVHLKRLPRGLSPSRQEMEVLETYHKFKPKKVIVDVSLFGASMIENLKQEQIPVIGYTFSPPIKRYQLLYALRRAFEDLKIEIPYSESAKKISNILITELQDIHFDKGKMTCVGPHDDTVIALALAYHVASVSGRVITKVVSHDSPFINSPYYNFMQKLRSHYERHYLQSRG